jgi:hypothetical protein
MAGHGARSRHRSDHRGGLRPDQPALGAVDAKNSTLTAVAKRRESEPPAIYWSAHEKTHLDEEMPTAIRCPVGELPFGVRPCRKS